MFMNMLKEQKNRGYIIAFIGGIVGVIAFYLPFVTYTSVNTSGTPTAVSQSYSVNGQIFGLVSVAFLFTVLIVALAAFMILSPNPFGSTSLTQDRQVQYGNYAIVGLAALVFLFTIIFAFGDHGFTLFNENILSSGSGISAGLSVGFWFFLLASLAMIAGGILAIRPNLLSRGAGAYQQPYQQPYSAYPTADQQPYSSYQGQYPQQQTYPPQYPPQQAYPPQQSYQQPDQFAPTERASQPQYPPQQGYQQPEQFSPTERAQQPQYPPQQQQYPQQYPPQQQPPQQ
jgi:hypothetical protein